MKIIFCEDPLDPRRPDEAYQFEANAAKAAGFDYRVISYEALVDGNDPSRAVRGLQDVQPPELGVYRGWMLRPDRYAQLYAALLQKGIQLINDPAAYTHCHYLPESFPVIEAFTAKTVWQRTREGIPGEELARLLRPFGAKPIIVKDFVKSQKHYWAEACFIPSAADLEAVMRVVGRFIELQGEDLNEGLVFREYVELEPLSAHSRSKMPLTKEFRVFVLDGRPLATAEYWEEGDYTGIEPPLDTFGTVMQQVRSRFFTMDIAKCRDGGWMIVELGDAQVAGLPDRIDAGGFYQALRKRL